MPGGEQLPQSTDHTDGVTGEEEGQSNIIVQEEKKLKRPHLYKVLIHNDDYTTMDFVILVLTKYFGKSKQEAMDIMMNVHQKGIGVCGVYTYEIAETKCQKVVVFSKRNGHPLKCTIEKD